jgi:seryl-tRNA synthetase
VIFTELRKTGEIEYAGNGRLVLQGRPLAIFRWIDSQFESMAVSAGAKVIQVPALIERDVLTRAGFFEAFGDVAVRVGNTDGEQHLFSPALCYHAYAALADRFVEGPVMLTTVGRCSRDEGTAAESRTRLGEFTMREVIFIGADQWVRDERHRWTSRVSAFAGSLGLSSELAVATDPFFVDAARGQKLMQQLKELKVELRMAIHDEPSVAVASMNLHESFFGLRFGLRAKNGSIASSACVAFGIERWTLAMIAQLGVDHAIQIATSQCSTTNT